MRADAKQIGARRISFSESTGALGQGGKEEFQPGQRRIEVNRGGTQKKK